MLSTSSWEKYCGEIEKVPKTCHFNLPTRSSYLYVNSEDYNNKKYLETSSSFPWQHCCRDWVVTELFIAEMLLMVWDHSQRVPTASSHSSSVKWKNMPFSSFIVVVGRFASSTNCLFMHSAERRFCCHTNFEVVEKARKGRRNVMTSDVHLSPINLHQKRKVRVENIIHVVCDKSWSKLIEYLRWFNFYFYFSATFHVNHFVVFIVSHVKPQEVIWYRDIKWNTPNHVQFNSHFLTCYTTTNFPFPLTLLFFFCFFSHERTYVKFTSNRLWRFRWWDGTKINLLWRLLWYIQLGFYVTMWCAENVKMEIVKLKSQIKILLYKANMLNAPIK